MPLNKPYKRIARPFISEPTWYVRHSIGESHFLDDRYSTDRIALIRAYHLLQKDFLEIFDYIEPTNRNENTYSHRLYELFLRAATEFETNCTGILRDNNYQKTGRTESDWNITDYSKIEQALKLSEFEIAVSIWQGNKQFYPLREWSQGHSLCWYQDYNKVKHDRNKNLEKANLKNSSCGVGLVLAIFLDF